MEIDGDSIVRLSITVSVTNVDWFTRRLRNLARNLQQRALARSIAANGAYHFSTLHFKR